MTNPKIERFEWDFDSCPADQLELCFEYERARSSRYQQEIKDAESWRRMTPGITFDDYWKQIAPPNDRTADGHVTAPWNAVFLYPEFPLTPYLQIPEPERNRRFALFKSVGVEPVGADDAKLSKEFRDKHGAEDQSWFEQGIHELRGYFGFDLAEFEGVSRKVGKYEIEGNSIKYEGDATIAVFRFEWGACSDAGFIDALRAWLDKNRLKPVSEGMDARGGGSASRQFRSQLKQLGAWRLLNVPMTCEEAENYTQAMRKNREPLYSQASAWSRAKGEADTFLGRMYNH